MHRNSLNSWQYVNPPITSWRRRWREWRGTPGRGTCVVKRWAMNLCHCPPPRPSSSKKSRPCLLAQFFEDWEYPLIAELLQQIFLPPSQEPLPNIPPPPWSRSRSRPPYLTYQPPRSTYQIYPSPLIPPGFVCLSVFLSVGEDSSRTSYF